MLLRSILISLTKTSRTAVFCGRYFLWRVSFVLCMNSEFHNCEFFLWKSCYQEKLFGFVFFLRDHIKQNVIKIYCFVAARKYKRKTFWQENKKSTTQNQLLEVTFYVTSDLTEIEETKWRKLNLLNDYTLHERSWRNIVKSTIKLETEALFIFSQGSVLKKTPVS